MPEPILSLTLPRPDDLHLHVRDGAAMASVLPHTARNFGRALLMPNLRPPVRTVAEAGAYRERALRALEAAGSPEGAFTPYFALYLTADTPAAEVRAARASGSVLAFKLYPAGATTHSDAGVRDLRQVIPVLEAMEAEGVPLCLHAESIDPAVDVFDRERVFLEEQGRWLLDRFPRLRLVVEHITTGEAARFVLEGPETVAATVTPQHLLLNRGALFQGGVRPHHWCLPVLKRERHRQALLAAIRSGNPRLFLGTDSAPHARDAKEAACGCAGCFTAPHALALYAMAFEEAGALHHLPDFAARHGAAFYGLPPAAGTITLERAPWPIPAAWPFGDREGAAGEVVPLFAGETVPWRVR